MKMSDYFKLPIDSTGVIAINNHCTIQDNNDGVAPYDAATLAINNHDLMVGILCKVERFSERSIFPALPLSVIDSWCEIHDDISALLKELGHEI